MPQVRIDLDEDLFAALRQYADEEIRDPSGQALWIVRHALRARTMATAVRYPCDPLPAPAAPLIPSEEEAQIFGSVP